MKTIITVAAAVALSIGLAGTAAATSPDAAIGPQITKDSGIAQAGCYYRYFYRWYCY